MAENVDQLLDREREATLREMQQSLLALRDHAREALDLSELVGSRPVLMLGGASALGALAGAFVRLSWVGRMARGTAKAGSKAGVLAGLLAKGAFRLA